MSSLNKPEKSKTKGLFECSCWTKEHGSYVWHLPNGFDLNQKREVVLAFSRRPVFLRVGWFAKRTGPCNTQYYRQFTTDNNIINKPVNKKKIVDDDEDEDEEVKEIFRLKDNNVEKKKKTSLFQRHSTPKSLEKMENASSNYCPC